MPKKELKMTDEERRELEYLRVASMSEADFRWNLLARIQRMEKKLDELSVEESEKEDEESVEEENEESE